ncbi:hypothetical protein [Cupriavidus necator]|uniref:hypothetical protein n=1 Tax=Cupriavidus necator TaxID=106590 RepID=UPI00339DA6D7
MAGLAGALFLLFWPISGWLSVKLNPWFNGRIFNAAALQRYAGHAAPTLPFSHQLAHSCPRRFASRRRTNGLHPCNIHSPSLIAYHPGSR